MFKSVKEEFYQKLVPNAEQGLSTSSVHYYVYGEDSKAHHDELYAQFPFLGVMKEAVVPEHFIASSCALWCLQNWIYWAVKFC